MIKIKDRIMLAGVASVIAQGANRLSYMAQKHLGGDEIRYDTTIASFFLTPSKAKTPTGTLVGFIGNLINGAVLATMTTYLLGATGRDKAIIKGMGAIAMLGSDNLFPDSAKIEGHLPLVYTGSK